MGIETLNPSNSNESQVSLRDPVRTCVPTQCIISPFRKAEIIVPDYGTRACRVFVCQTNAVLRTCVSNKRSPPCLSVKQLCLSVKQTQSSTVVHVPLLGLCIGCFALIMPRFMPLFSPNIAVTPTHLYGEHNRSIIFRHNSNFCRHPMHNPNPSPVPYPSDGIGPSC